MDRAPAERCVVDEDVSLPGLPAGDPSDDPARRRLAELGGRHASPLAHAMLELAIAPLRASIAAQRPALAMTGGKAAVLRVGSRCTTTAVR
jgi:hypothetical protein